MPRITYLLYKLIHFGEKDGIMKIWRSMSEG